MSEIEGLETHCRAPLMTTDARARWLQDWCADLAEFPADAVGAAVREWRLSGNTKFPTPGLLLPMVRAKLPRKPGPEAPRAWAPISDAEYDALTLSEKVRHQKILAAEARKKAGPMFRNTAGVGRMHRPTGTHLTAEEMPERWHRFSAIAAGHEAEAERLRQLLLRAQSERAA